MTQEELQKLLTSFEQEVGHIKQWQIDKNERMRNQASHAAKVGYQKGAYKNNGGINNQILERILVWKFDKETKSKGEFIGEYTSMTECGNQLTHRFKTEITKMGISKMINRNYRQYKGLVFEKKS